MPKPRTLTTYLSSLLCFRIWRKLRELRARTISILGLAYLFQQHPLRHLARSFLPVHAKVFALGSKYDIPHLQRRSLAKFKAAARLWSKDELVESIPIAFNTAPDNNSLRVAINAIITANSARLTDDSVFEDAVNGVEGLAFELFRQQTLHRRGRRTCLGCNLVYKSRCAVDGCPPNGFGERHKCDKGDICMSCRNYA